MNEHGPSGSHGVSRRALARGAAWAVPTVTVAAAAPAAAISGAPVSAALTIPLYASYTGSGNASQYTFRSVTSSGSTTTGSSFCVSNTTASSALSQAKVTLYLPIGSGVTFSNGSGGSACWNPLTYDPSAGTKSYDGCTLYAYTATYACAISASSGSTCLPALVFTSSANAPALCTPNWYKSASVVYNGTTLTATSGPNQYQ